MKSKRLLLALSVGLFASLPLGIEPQAANPDLLTRLEQMAGDCEWKVRTRTGGPKGVLLLHHAKMERVIDHLKAGQAVDPKVIDAVIEEHRS